MEPIRILIADDHALFREGLRAILSSVADMEIVGEAGTGHEVLHLAAELVPDVILMDIQMPEINGVEATRLILKDLPQTGIIILTMLEDDDSLFSAIQAGARGYVLKGADKAEMLRSIRSVVAGEALFGPAVASRLLLFFKEGSGVSRKQVSPEFEELTEREREVLALMTRGMPNTEIADRLMISLKTVQNHVTNIYNKLQVSDRAQAVLRAKDEGF